MALSSDPNTIVLTYALHEEPIGEEASFVVERTENGEVVGEVLPDNNHNNVFRFQGLSAKESYNPALTEQDTRRVLNKFYAGGELRVYRNFPADIDAFGYPRSYMNVEGDTNNTDGYSDIVAVEIRDLDYAWFDNVLQRFEFSIEGVAVR